MIAVSSEVLPVLVVVFIAGVLHASLQVSPSALTILGIDAKSKHVSHPKYLKLLIIFSFVSLVLNLGFLMIFLAIKNYFVNFNFGQNYLWFTLFCSMTVYSLVFSAIYFQSKSRIRQNLINSTKLWIPKSITKSFRYKKKLPPNGIWSTKLATRAVLVELPFSTVFLIVATSVIDSKNPNALPLLYAVTSVLPLFMLTALTGGGKNFNQIQKWRAKNKLFLKNFTPMTTMILATYVMIEFCLIPMANSWGTL